MHLYSAGSIYIYKCVSVPEQSNAETDHDVVERVEAHHAHQQILQDDLKSRGVTYIKLCER